MAKNKTYTVITDRGKDVKSVPITGAWGGITPDSRMVVAHMYTEYNAIPNIIDIEVDQDGKILKDDKRISRGDMVREVHSTLVMNPDVAISIGQWLIQNGNLALDLGKKK